MVLLELSFPYRKQEKKLGKTKEKNLLAISQIKSN